MIVQDAPLRDAALSRQMLALWEEMRSRNPRLFDGPLLTVRDLDTNTGTLKLQRDTYMPYAVQPEIDTKTISLGVTAIIAHGTGTSTAYLLGQRASRTHMYPDQWEFGPSGALSPPDSNSLTLAHIHQQLAAEISEEIGLTLTLSHANTSPLCLALDPVARSIDLVMLITLDHRPTLSSNWEYQSVQWVNTTEFQSWANNNSLIPPSHSIMRLLNMAV